MNRHMNRHMNREWIVNGLLPTPWDQAISSRSRHAARIGVRLKVGEPLLVEVENIKADGRRQITLLPLGVDGSNQVRQGPVLPARDLLQTAPEFVLQAHARLVTRQDDRPLDD